MSTHECLVVPVVMEAHPNADALSVVKVFGYTVCVRTEDWKGKSLGIYIPPDSICPKNEMFSFLGDKTRIKVKKLRGVISQGLLIPAPEDAKEGDDYFEKLGITHYDPPEPASTGGEVEHGPAGFYPKYDVESFNRYNMVIHNGEDVVVTEKLHGANSRFLYKEGRFWAGSRTEWKRENSENLWWKVLYNTPELQEWMKRHPELVVYGEVYGQVQDLKYGQNGVKFAGFDILRGNEWLSWDEVLQIKEDLPWVPVLYEGPFNEEMIRSLAEGDSSIVGANHLREGVVVKPRVERTHMRLGRVLLKIVSNRYLER